MLFNQAIMPRSVEHGQWAYIVIGLIEVVLICHQDEQLLRKQHISTFWILSSMKTIKKCSQEQTTSIAESAHHGLLLTTGKCSKWKPSYPCPALNFFFILEHRIFPWWFIIIYSLFPYRIEVYVSNDDGKNLHKRRHITILMQCTALLYVIIHL